MASELHNGEHKEEWPAADLSPGVGDPADDSDAPVLGDAATGETGEALGGDGDIRGAGNVDIHNGGARDIDATTVSITQGGARDIDATTVTINQGGAGSIRAEELSISQGGVGLARVDHLRLQEGGNAFAVIAEDATLDSEASVFLLIAGSARGDIRPVLDWRSAAALGAAFALVVGILRRALR